MKKAIALLMCAVISVFAFAGCGAAKETADNATEAMTKASDAVSQAASEMDETGQGDVTDDNGFISDDDDESTTE